MLAALAVLGGVPALTRPDPLRHDHTKTWAYARAPHTAATPSERFFASVASELAGRPVSVRCEGLDASLAERGAVAFHGTTPADYARIRPEECGALIVFRRDPLRHAGPAAAEALDVLAHESMHLSGVRDEAVAECLALQALPRAAAAFGGSAGEGRALALYEYTHVYPSLPAAYRSRECRPGGALDRGGLDLAG